ncbi:MAG: ABC transporter ATP-binding protein [Candidatus Gracilibacteria bacterium]|nr:ABC transporter ATP-binding protein [Candidatus Gracilibacteria bacterium]
MSVVLEAQSIGKVFPQGKKNIHALKNVSLKFQKGEFVVIWGSSGSGKSSLLSILAGLDKPSSGKIFLDGDRIDTISESEQALLRRDQIGFVFQSFHLVPSLTALENIQLPLDLKKDPQASKKARELLKSVGLDHRAQNFSYQLSGGEQQRVALARALISEPQILFADEPTGSLDSQNSKEILVLLQKLRKKKETTLVLVTHEPALASLADRVITLKDGQLVEDQSGKTFAKKANIYTLG